MYMYTYVTWKALLAGRPVSCLQAEFFNSDAFDGHVSPAAATSKLENDYMYKGLYMGPNNLSCVTLCFIVFFCVPCHFL